ncbi:hypothetical protein B7P43_G09904 [Cryptotermes secundus]|uniref:Uncharacterized protein n=1 Tax=Cryptotermes secundus TaxID=105785 RepID=A0A2J7RDF8_9NEOP|nr:hypothetical protein B7P43_G09904 [Cryptotermes secundus]
MFPKHWAISKLHIATMQDPKLLIDIAMKTSNQTWYSECLCKISKLLSDCRGNCKYKLDRNCCNFGGWWGDVKAFV